MKAFTFERTTTYPPIHLSKNKTQPLVLTSKDPKGIVVYMILVCFYEIYNNFIESIVLRRVYPLENSSSLLYGRGNVDYLLVLFITKHFDRRE